MYGHSWGKCELSHSIIHHPNTFYVQQKSGTPSWSVIDIHDFPRTPLRRGKGFLESRIFLDVTNVIQKWLLVQGIFIYWCHDLGFERKRLIKKLPARLIFLSFLVPFSQYFTVWFSANLWLRRLIFNSLGNEQYRTIMTHFCSEYEVIFISFSENLG